LNSDSDLPRATTDLQEASGWLCDRGSDVAVLERKFADSKLDFSGIPADWNRKEGPWAPTPEALAKRAVKVRRWLRERPEKQVVVVTHAGFLHWLTQDTVQFDNAEWRTYTFAGDGENDEEARLTQIEKDGEIEKFRI